MTDFLFLGNHPVFDFLNTVQRLDGELVDRLDSPTAFERWAVELGSKTADFEVDKFFVAGGEDLEQARRLREALRRLFELWRQGLEPGGTDLHTLNEILGRRQEAPRLVAQGVEIQWMRDDRLSSAGALLLYLAEQAAELLTGGERRRAKTCDHEACVLHFWDTSRNLSRRWCSMATCGNRSKVARHYHRHREV